MTERLNTPILAANWKMHKTPAATREFFQQFSALHQPREDRTVIFFPPAVSLISAAEALQARRDLELGVQNIHWQAQGAFTGETSAPMAHSAGATFALIGHSERRHLFGETDDEVRLKVAAAIAHGLTPLICVGETLEERKASRVDEVILRQLDAAIAGLPAEFDGAFAIAYEPVWAIGTGVTATPDDAAEAHRILQQRLQAEWDRSNVPILYGGSVKAENAADLLHANAVSGLLVGGASLDPHAFARIAAAG